jgi:hypothetical protein
MTWLARTSLWSLLVLTAVRFSPAQPPASAPPEAYRIDRVEILEKGIYRVPILKRVADPNVVSGQHMVYGKREHVQDTTTIPATTGIQFGFRYVVVGEPQGTKVPVRVIAVYPPGGRYNPNTGKTFAQDVFYLSQTIGSTTSHFCFTLASWGHVLGPWTLQVWDQDRKLAEQTFTLVEP